MKILVCSKNPSKINGTFKAFEENFSEVEILTIQSDSLVPDQPLNNQIFQGALNRINGITIKENYDYLVAIESGLQELYGNSYIMQVAVIKDKNGIISSGISPSFPVPKKYKDQILLTNLNEVICTVFNEDEDAGRNGSIIKLTNGKINRTDLCYYAVSMALVTFLNSKKWCD